jgi:hypothetical protein
LIKKQKRKLFADIDLSDNGLFDYKGIELTKADCEKAIEELENPDYVTYYLYLAKDNQPLNDLLVNGDERFFMSYREYSTYKVPRFVDFISPYFALRFDKALSHAVKHESLVDVQNILQTQNLINLSEQNVAFKSTSIIISNNIKEIEEITKKIKNGETAWTATTISGLISYIKMWSPVSILNALPKYFQSQINKTATAINQLHNAIWKKLYNPHVSRLLLEHLLALNIESVYKQTFENNYKIVKEADEKANRIALERVSSGIEAEKRREAIEKLRLEAAQRQKWLANFEAEKRQQEVERHQEKIRTRCFWIIGISISLAVIFAIWGTDGLSIIGAVAMWFIISWVIAQLKN